MKNRNDLLFALGISLCFYYCLLNIYQYYYYIMPVTLEGHCLEFEFGGKYLTGKDIANNFADKASSLKIMDGYLKDSTIEFGYSELREMGAKRVSCVN